jgi:hypothetical protein
MRIHQTRGEMGIKLICLQPLSKYRYQDVYLNLSSGFIRNGVKMDITLWNIVQLGYLE